MRYIHRYCIRADDEAGQSALELLTRNGIPYSPPDPVIPLIVFKISEDAAYWPDFKKWMEKHGEISSLSVVCTKKELQSLPWLSVRSKWRWEYPQPEEEYRKITYDAANFCKECGNGLVQKDSFYIKKTPHWGKRNFFMLNWIQDELFMNDKAARQLEESGLSGFQIIDVKNSGTGAKLNDIHQLFVTSTLPPALMNSDEVCKAEIHCPKCGHTKWVASGRVEKLKKEAFCDINVDIVKSFETYGAGLMCCRDILVSQKFYRMLCDKELTNYLHFEPVLLV